MRFLLGLAVFVLAFSADSHAARKPKALKKVPMTQAGQVFITSKVKFDNKAVACRYKGSNKFESGFVKKAKKKNTWFNISEYIKGQQKAGRNVSKLKKQATRANKACKGIQNTCTPSLTASGIEALENTPILVPVNIAPVCGLETQIVRIQDPARGSIEASADGLIYTPFKHFMGQDVVKIAAANMFKQSAAIEIPITIRQLRAEFAGDKNSLEPYRKDLTRAEVMSVLKRIGLGGDRSLWSIRNTDQLADALLNDTETPQAEQMFQAYNTERVSRAQSADAYYNPRYFYGDIQAINASYLRYGRSGRTWMGMIFWGNHFATDVSGFSNSDLHPVMMDHFHTLLDNGIGNFRTLMFRMFHDLPFQAYLNNTTNTFAMPSQNFPREFLELFTAGAKDPITQEDNYRESEVETSTRFLAGWGYNGSVNGYRSNSSSTPTAPINLQATDNDPYFDPGSTTCSTRTANKITLTWEAHPHAFRIRVFRAPRGSSTFTQLAELWGGTSIYQDTGDCGGANLPVSGTIYDYRIQAVSSSNVTSAFSATDSGYFGNPPTALSSPITTATGGAYENRIDVVWSPVSGAAGYRVYKVSNDGARRDTPITGVLPANQFTYEDYHVIPGQTYMYYVRAVAANRSMSPRAGHGSSEVDVAKGYAYQVESRLGMVENIQVSSGTRADGVLLTWDLVPNAVSYRIFRGQSWLPIYNRLIDVRGDLTSYIDTSASASSHYQYVILAVDANGAVGTIQRGSKFNPNNWALNADNLDPRTFLAWLPDNHPNAAGKLMGPVVSGEAQGVAMSAFGQGFPGQPVGSFVDHVITNWPATRRNIAAKLFAQIVHRDLSEALVSEVAHDLYANQFNLQPVLRKLFTSSAMFSPEANGTGVANPSEVIFSALRLAELPISKKNTLAHLAVGISASGHDLGAPPNVFGFPDCGLVRGGQIHDGSAWIQGPQTYLTVGNTLSNMLNVIRYPSPGGEALDVINFFSPPSINTPGALVDHIAGIFNVPLSPEQRAVLVTYLGTSNAGTPSTWNRTQIDRLSGLIRLMVMSVEFLKK